MVISYRTLALALINATRTGEPITLSVARDPSRAGAAAAALAELAIDIDAQLEQAARAAASMRDDAERAMEALAAGRMPWSVSGGDHFKFAGAIASVEALTRVFGGLFSDMCPHVTVADMRHCLGKQLPEISVDGYVQHHDPMTIDGATSVARLAIAMATEIAEATESAYRARTVARQARDAETEIAKARLEGVAVARWAGGGVESFIALVNGEYVRDRRDNARHFVTADAAVDAARKAARKARRA